MRWALSTFRQHALAFVALAAIIVGLRFLQPYVADRVSSSWLACTLESTTEEVSACLSAQSGSLFASAALSLAFIVITLVAAIGVYRAALRSTLGQSPSFADLLSGENFGRYVRVTLVQIAMIFGGLILCFLPGLLIAFFVQLAHVFVLDRGYRAFEAVRASFVLVGRNVGPAIIMTLISILLLIPGLLFAPLILLALPINALFVVHMYRQFNDEPVFT